MQKYIYLSKNQDTITAHSSLESLLEHPNGLPVSRQYFYTLKKEGFPFTYKGIEVNKIPLFNTNQSKALEIQSRIL